MKSTKRLMLIFLIPILLSPGSHILKAGEIYEYDAEGRLTKVTFGDSVSISYTYDPNGNMLQIEVAPTSVVSVEDSQTGVLPKVFALDQNYPNPFNPGTQIKYQLPVAAQVNLAIYNVLGRKVRTLVDGEKVAGFYSVQWDGLNDYKTKVGSGVYFVRIEARGTDSGNFVLTQKMTLLR